MTRWRAILVAAVASMPSGCSCGSPPALRTDAVADAGAEPCETVCAAPRLLASIGFADDSTRAMLDVAGINDDLVILTTNTGPGEQAHHQIHRVSLDGEAPRSASVTGLVTSRAVAAGSSRATEQGMRVLALLSNARLVTDPQPVRVAIVTWETPDTTPTIAEVALSTSPIPGCLSCLRIGATVFQDDSHAVAAVAGDAQLFVVRIAFADLSTERWVVPLPGGSSDGPAGGGADGAGRALVTAGGSLASVSGSYEGEAFALAIETTTLGALMPIPGGSHNPPPHVWVRGDRTDVLRFQENADAVTGRIHRYAVQAGRLEEMAPIETSDELAPIAIATTSSALLWASTAPALAGASDLYVLAHKPACSTEAPTYAAHVPWPLVASEGRAIAATHHRGRTYVALSVVRDRRDRFIDVLDLGVCDAIEVR